MTVHLTSNECGNVWQGNIAYSPGVAPEFFRISRGAL